jgi:hypothetical protein
VKSYSKATAWLLVFSFTSRQRKNLKPWIWWCLSNLGSRRRKIPKIHFGNHGPGVEDIHIDMEPGQKVSVKTSPGTDGKKLFEDVRKRTRGKITRLISAHHNPVIVNNNKNKEQQSKKVHTVDLLFLFRIVRSIH